MAKTESHAEAQLIGDPQQQQEQSRRASSSWFQTSNRKFLFDTTD